MNKSFTMIEFIATIVILAIVSLFSYRFFTRAIELYVLEKREKWIYDEANFSQDRIVRELRDAKDIDTPHNGEDGSTLAFTMTHPTLDYKFSSPPYNVRYRKVGSHLYRKGKGRRKEICQNVYLFQVKNEKNFIYITLTLKTGKGESIKTKTGVYPKNLPFSEKPFSGPNFNGDFEEDIE